MGKQADTVLNLTFRYRKMPLIIAGYTFFSRALKLKFGLNET